VKRVPMSYQSLSANEVCKDNEADVLRFLERIAGCKISCNTLQFVERVYPLVQALLQQKTKKDVVRLLRQKRKEMSALAVR